MRTVTLTLSYSLTSEAHKALNIEADAPVAKDQKVDVTAVPLQVALERGAVELRDDGSTRQCDKACKLAVGRYHVNREGEINSSYEENIAIDHVLTANAAWALWQHIPELNEARKQALQPEVEKANAKLAEEAAARAATEAANAELKTKIMALCAEKAPNVQVKRSGNSYEVRIDGEKVFDRVYWNIDNELHAVLDAQVEIQKQRELAIMAAWISDHGSERLKLALSIGEHVNCRGAYKTERLAQTFEGLVPGTWKWNWVKDDGVGENDRINPSLDELQSLDKWRKHFPDAKLQVFVWEGKGEDEDGRKTDWKEVVVTVLVPWANKRAYTVLTIL